MIAQAEMEKAKAAQMDVQRKMESDKQTHAVEMKRLELDYFKLKLEAEKYALKGVMDGNKEENRKSEAESRLILDSAKASADTVVKMRSEKAKQREAAASRTHDMVRESVRSAAKRDDSNRDSQVRE
jgi:hypothetical protein